MDWWDEEETWYGGDPGHKHKDNGTKWSGVNCDCGAWFCF